MAVERMSGEDIARMDDQARLVAWLERELGLTLARTMDPRWWCLDLQPEGSELRLDWVFVWDGLDPPTVADALQALADQA